MSPCTRTGFRAARSTWCSTWRPIACANLAFDPKVIESERGVVYSERRLRTDDSNEGFLHEQVQATAFLAHPYQIPTIGWPSDIQSWKIEDLKKFFATNYAPNNCTLILVGDLSAEEGFALARKYLEPIPRQEPPPPVRTVEPEQLGEKRVFVERDAQTPLLMYGYKSPAANDPQGPAINLLMTVLTEGNSSRLHRLLVEEKKLAIEVGGHFNEGFDPSLTWLQLTLPEGVQVAEVEKVLDAALDQVVAQGVTDAELARAKNLYASSFWKQIATINGKAQLVGFVRSVRRRLPQVVRLARRLRQGHSRGPAESRGTGVPEESPHGGCAGVEAMKYALAQESLRAAVCRRAVVFVPSHRVPLPPPWA